MQSLNFTFQSEVVTTSGREKEIHKRKQNIWSPQQEVDTGFYEPCYSIVYLIQNI